MANGSKKGLAISGKYTITGSLARKFAAIAKAEGLPHDELAHIYIDNSVAVSMLADAKKRHAAVQSLARLLKKLPGVHRSIGTSEPGDAFWWTKFTIDIKHPLAWHVVQRLGYVLNYYSLEQKFECKFYPASPPPDLNGGPAEFLSWVIEAKLGCVDPLPIVKTLRAALPRTLSDSRAWKMYD